MRKSVAWFRLECELGRRVVSSKLFLVEEATNLFSSPLLLLLVVLVSWWLSLTGGSQITI
jgi:hypothetical protein